MSKIVLLNGPAGSGKDTIAQKMIAFGYEQCEFKESLFEIAYKVSGVCPFVWHSRYEDRVLKETPWEALGGLTQRELLIKISEEWVKPVFGEDHFGKLAEISAGGLIEKGYDVVFSDSGFQEESGALIDSFGTRNVILIRLIRDGYTFDGDSRSYIDPEYGQPYLELKLEEGNPDLAVDEIIRFIGRVDAGEA